MLPPGTSSQGSPGPTAAPGCREGGAGHGASPGRQTQLGPTAEGMGQDASPGCRAAGTYGDTGRSQGAHGARRSLLPTQPGQPLQGKETGGALGGRAPISPSWLWEEGA